MSNLKKLAIKGTIWTLISYGGGQGLRLIFNLILTRLLEPKLFGLMALVSTLINGLQTFSDVGLNIAIIQNKRGEEETFYNTVWTMQIVRGLILWLGSCLIAWPASYFYKNQQLLYLIPIIGFTMVTTGFTSTSIFTLNRRLEMAKFTIYELGNYLVGLVAMLIWALINPSIWVLVGGIFISSISRMITSFGLIPNYSNRFVWDKSSVGEIFSIGKWIFISTMFTFIATQSDTLVLARVASINILGIYTIALTFALTPQMVNGQISNKVLFPLLSMISSLPRHEFREKIIKQRKPILLFGIFLITLFVCFGDLLILNLYDKRYIEASWMLPILALGIWPNLLFESSRLSLFSLGNANYQAWGQIVKSIHMTVGLYIGYQWLGILGFIIVVALNDIGAYIIIAYGLIREKISCLTQDFWATMLLMGTISFVLILRYSLGFGTPLDVLFTSNLG